MCVYIIAFEPKSINADEPRHDKTCLRKFPTRLDTNWPSAIEFKDIILSKQ